MSDLWWYLVWLGHKRKFSRAWSQQGSLDQPLPVCFSNYLLFLSLMCEYSRGPSQNPSLPEVLLELSGCDRNIVHSFSTQLTNQLSLKIIPTLERDFCYYQLTHGLMGNGVVAGKRPSPSVGLPYLWKIEEYGPWEFELSWQSRERCYLKKCIDPKLLLFTISLCLWICPKPFWYSVGVRVII